MAPIADLIPGTIYDPDRKFSSPATSAISSLAARGVSRSADTSLAQKFLQVETHPLVELEDLDTLTIFAAGITPAAHLAVPAISAGSHRNVVTTRQSQADIPDQSLGTGCIHPRSQSCQRLRVDDITCSNSYHKSHLLQGGGSLMIPAPSEQKIQMYSGQYYAACTVGGILSCGLTHTAVTPLDVVKCKHSSCQVGPFLKAKHQSTFMRLSLIISSLHNLFRCIAPTLYCQFNTLRLTCEGIKIHAGNMQTDPGKYKSIPTGFAVTVREGGLAGLVRGWAPTLLGYSVQGAGKFGLYEFFKK